MKLFPNQKLCLKDMEPEILRINKIFGNFTLNVKVKLLSSKNLKARMLFVSISIKKSWFNFKKQFFFTLNSENTPRQTFFRKYIPKCVVQILF